MRSDFIKPLLKDYQVYGFNFKNNNINIFKNNPFDVQIGGSVQYIKGFTNSDLWINGNKITMLLPNLFNSNIQFTAIYKYNVRYFGNPGGGYFIPNRNLGGFGANLYASGGKFGLWNRNKTWFTDGKNFGDENGINYELAVEGTQNKFKIWLNGVLQRVYSRSWELDQWFNFGDPEHHLQIWVNDILITDALFLPDNYTVDWDNNWFDKFNRYLYNHDQEVLAIPKKEE